MRLALIRERYVAHEMERYEEAALEALLERNVAISVYTRHWPETRLQLIEPVICDPPYAGRLLREWGFARAACQTITKAPPELVQSNVPMPCCDFYHAVAGVHATRAAQHARVASRGEQIMARFDPYRRYLLASERKVLTSDWLRAVACPSWMVREDIHRTFGVALDRLHIIPPPVDTDAFHPGLRSLRGWLRERHHIPDPATLHLICARDYVHDGVPVVIAALALLPPTSHLLVLGAEGHLAHYTALADQLGVRERVTFAGAQSEPKPYLGAADTFVLPTLYDACSQATLDAMACGLPVITSTHSGVAELVDTHQAGFVTDALDVKAIAEQMRALEDANLRQRLGENARKAVLPFTSAAVTLKLVLVYRDLLSPGSPVSSSPDTRTRTLAAQAQTLGSMPEVAAPPAMGDAAAELPRDTEVPVLDEPVPEQEMPPELEPGAGGTLAREPPADKVDRA